jgi:hypothetical protein
MATPRSRHVRRGNTGKAATKSRRARRKVQVERHYHRRYAGAKGKGPAARRTRTATRPAIIRRRQTKPATAQRRTYRPRIALPAPKAAPISAASYLSMF